MFPRLETERLILRPFREDDVPLLVAYRSEPEVARYQSWDAPYSLAQGEAMLTRMHQRPAGTPGMWYQVAIELKATAELTGDCAFCVADDAPPAQAEIGYTIATAFQHHGYGTEAATCLIDYLFQVFGLHRIRASCDTENAASARLLERLGMRCEGHFVESVWSKGQWTSELHYAILAREWRMRRGT